MNDGLKDKHRKAIIDLLAAHERVERVVLFGSRAMGTFTTTSDVDLALYGEKLTLSDQADLAAAIEERPMPQRVDLLLFNTIKNEKLLAHIKKHGVEWFRRDGGKSADWPLVELSELVKDLTVGFVGSMTQEYVEKGVPFFRSKNIKPYDLEWADIKYVSRQFHEKLKKSALVPGDVVIVRTGIPGTACVIPESVEEANCSDVVIARVNDKKLSAHYLSYFMNSVAAHQVSSHLVGAVQQHFNVGSAKKIKIPLPSRDEQEEIVTVLKTLDDKIKLNRRINQTLEEMAQAIFKSWFVDFEPVKAKTLAKANGQDPERAAMCAISGKSDAELDHLPPAQLAQLRATAALFPDELTDSELGLIPNGWEVKPFPEIIEVNPRRILRKGEIAPYLDMANVPTNSARAGNVAQREFSSGSKFVNGDTLLARITPCLENGKTAFVDFLADEQVGWGSTEFIVFHPKEPLPPAFAYCLCRHPEFRSFAIANLTGTSGRQRVPNDCFINYFLPVPERGLALAFGNIVGSMMQVIKAQDEVAITLTQLRDTLLPKLLSGEISVNAAEPSIKEAV